MTLRKLRAPLAALLCITILLGLPAAGRAYTDVPVHDYINWILSGLQRLAMIYNQFEQIRKQTRQVELAAKTIQSFGDHPNWASLGGLFSDLDALFAGGDNLGYLYSQVEATWDDTFTGHLPPLRSWPADQQIRVERTFRTLRSVEIALHRIAQLNEDSEGALADLRGRSERADTPQKQLETHSMFLAFQAAEHSRSMQASLLAANVATVLGAEQLQRASTADIGRNDWIESNGAPPLDADTRGYTGVPRDWPWTVHF
jgi:conjugal transfer/entry exclusion protein